MNICVQLAASWEEGRYTSTHSAPEIIPRLEESNHKTAPPISTWISIAGSHEGVHIPLAAQVALQQASWMGDLGQSIMKIEAHKALEAQVAKELLRVYVKREYCATTSGVDGLTMWDTCEGRHIFRQGNFIIDGDECKNRVGNPNAQLWDLNFPGFTTDLYEAAMNGDSEEFDETIDPVPANLRGPGPSPNGWPQAVLKVGLTNGSWRLQGADHYGDAALSTFPNAVSADPIYRYNGLRTETLGQLRFIKNGTSFLGLCDRDSTVTLVLDPAVDPDAGMPGDVTGRNLNDLSPNAGPSQITTMQVDFFLPPHAPPHRLGPGL